MPLSKLEVPLALQVLCSVLGPGAPAQIFAAFFSDLTKDPYSCVLSLRTCFGSRTRAVASPPCCSRRAASVVTTTTAEAVASIPGQSSGSGRARAASPPRGRLGLRSLCCEEIKLLPWPAVPLWPGETSQPRKPGQDGCCQHSVSY